MTVTGTELQQMCCMIGSSNGGTFTSNRVQLQIFHVHIVLKAL